MATRQFVILTIYGGLRPVLQFFRRAVVMVVAEQLLYEDGITLAHRWLFDMRSDIRVLIALHRSVRLNHDLRVLELFLICVR